jgi:hypothetical protein
MAAAGPRLDARPQRPSVALTMNALGVAPPAITRTRAGRQRHPSPSPLFDLAAGGLFCRTRLQPADAKITTRLVQLLQPKPSRIAQSTNYSAHGADLRVRGVIVTESLRDIRIFVAAYEERSFTAAAVRERATQSGVSQHIRKLEEGFRVKLFNREKGSHRHRPPTPTTAAASRSCATSSPATMRRGHSREFRARYLSGSCRR